MLVRKHLKNRRIAVLAADGFDKVELTVSVDALRARGAQVQIVSLQPGSIRGVDLHEPAGRIRVDRTLAEAAPDDYDALLIPGGFINPDLLRQSAEAREFVRAFDLARKPIASLCHGPWVLAAAGLVDGRTITSWPGVRGDLVSAGAIWRDQNVVRDGNWVTSRGRQDIAPFVRAMCGLFASAWPLPYPGRRARGAAWSDPQWRPRAPSLVTTVTSALQRPSAQALLGLAVLGAGLAMAARRRHVAAA